MSEIKNHVNQIARTGIWDYLFNYSEPQGTAFQLLITTVISRNFLIILMPWNLSCWSCCWNTLNTFLQSGFVTYQVHQRLDIIIQPTLTSEERESPFCSGDLNCKTKYTLITYWFLYNKLTAATKGAKSRGEKCDREAFRMEGVYLLSTLLKFLSRQYLSFVNYNKQCETLSCCIQTSFSSRVVHKSTDISTTISNQNRLLYRQSHICWLQYFCLYLRRSIVWLNCQLM